MLRKVLHKVSVISMITGGVLIYGTMGSLEIDMMTLGEMFKYWIVGFAMLLGGWKCSKLLNVN